MSSRGNKDHRTISHEFGVVQLFRTCSNHSTELLSSSTAGLVSCVELWFEQVWKSWITSNSWEIILWSLFPLELRGLTRFSTPNSYQVPLQAWFLMLNYGSNRFWRVEPPWTHEKLCYDPCSIWSSEVWQGSVGLNYPELMRNYPMNLVPSVALWFEQVRKDWTTLNSCQVPLQVWFSVLSYGSNRFRRVETPQTQEKLSYDPCSL